MFEIIMTSRKIEHRRKKSNGDIEHPVYKVSIRKGGKK
jgi:hypothetical protein